ncbi:MAG: Pyruvate synthase subunit PorB [Candidatus Moranbacteria bacterium GW2011_GWE1_35_17]|nr:MAG: Pyruvate synthase subunit PorB [Candidatus Moranbacteria bacterium GW2011_GWE1_35_17]KKP69427.1 MAG: Pyruvate synthase subunit PorB [Candidatus Moranbacteria bacterium GW2011_GWE2_35_164]KKP82487.1 MAG: Pyruvate synthase subunit PorB [Candidatus Moranbacteria bacterium GW2011_GWF1_35_5]KKP84319.1 MAG: Pyruvate synthase subunit PorB [Candidatus Moranbacteria bacterium GW2011_GWF2_35_54]
MNQQLTKNYSPGGDTCAGCGIPVIVRNILDVATDPIVIINATGCLEVTSTIYPYTAWKVPYIHNAFENAAATAAGVEIAYQAMRKRGLIDKKIKFVVFGGDGGTFDIGLQSLSGMLERGHDVLYVAYDNEGYMNTGGQRSGATPIGASMETTPAGKKSYGNKNSRKNMMQIVAGHGVKYLAQANVAYVEDLRKKAKKALAVEGASFLLVFQPCTNVWKFPTSDYVKVGKLATETNYWPLYEIENGQYKLSLKNDNSKPIEEYLKIQKRFKHLFAVGNEEILENIQRKVDKDWEKLLKLSRE